jgi:hypothetical protein
MMRNRAAQRAVAMGLLGLLAWGCARNAPPDRTVDLPGQYTIEIGAIAGVDEPPTIRERVIGRIGQDQVRALLRGDDVLVNYLSVDAITLSARPYGGSAILVSLSPRPTFRVPQPTDPHAESLLAVDLEKRIEGILDAYLNTIPVDSRPGGPE